MGCPICGIDYKEIGGKAICPKCGRSRGYKQTDWVHILTQNETLKKREPEYLEQIKERDKIIAQMKREKLDLLQQIEQLRNRISQMNKEISQMPPRQRRINL